MSLDPRKEAIFEAWADYDYAPDEDAKSTAKCQRNGLIRELLDTVSPEASVTSFLDCFRNDYIAWLHSNGHSKRRRF